ncbi:SLC13 family permease [Methanotorris igneus]|uniref:Citrate transporter n=1 Tax=Methanotorris igneus (strain DSM 5666 / JCM 11834 / Kol 5) TaxID=880724 RepID=F6BDZ8_METIK|nr:SLC13 family permease [Methanotorris igneus]AEF96709.1 Citrate transporter [Methanotorris igneus Kol 5]
MVRINIDETIFLFFIFISILFLIFLIKPIEILDIVEWKTIFSLFYMLVVVNLLKDCGFLEWISLKIIEKTNRIFIVLILLTLLLSMFVTNDIALFVIIPITLIMTKYCNINLRKILMLEGISANIGSALTPFGNPQNLFIYYHYNLNLMEFIINMIPFEILGILILIPFLEFKKMNVDVNTVKTQKFKKEWLSYLAIFLLVIASILGIFNYIYLLPVILPIAFIKRIKIDYLFILTFCALFIDIEGLKRLGVIELFKISYENDILTMIYASLLSQIISNVPTTILLSNIYNNWLPIAYGVNVGGNGTLIASFANLITLRLSDGKISAIKFLMFGILVYILHLIALIIYFYVKNRFLI